MTKKNTKKESLKKKFLEWIKNLPEEEFKFLWPTYSREEILAFWSKEKEESIAEEIGLLCNQYLNKWPTEKKYDKAAQLLSLIPEDTPLSVYAFQYLRCCDGMWMVDPEVDFDPEKFAEVLKRYNIIISPFLP